MNTDTFSIQIQTKNSLTNMEVPYRLVALQALNTGLDLDLMSNTCVHLLRAFPLLCRGTFWLGR